MISGFSFGHNLIEAGYPFIEAIRAVQPFVEELVFVDMESTDDTRNVLQRLGVRILDSPWVCNEKPMNVAFRRHTECQGDTIIMFEADEVFDWTLLSTIAHMVQDAPLDLRVWRLQVSENFQRVKWYPHPVHRVFPRGGGSYVENPVIAPESIPVIPNDHGFLWDCSGCFRDNWKTRRRNHQAVWGAPRDVGVPAHFLEPTEIGDIDKWLAQPHWEWRNTPLAIPKILEPLVGMTSYRMSGR